MSDPDLSPRAIKPGVSLLHKTCFFYIFVVQKLSEAALAAMFLT